MTDRKSLSPRNGHTLMALIGARISGCSGQKDVSLEDQIDHGMDLVRELYDGPVEFKCVATKGKGERLDRPELAEMEAALRTRIYDVVVFEDLGRYVRGAAAIIFLGIAFDHGTRVLTPNDGIDTADDAWEADAIGACRDHVGHNSHTSLRIKHKMMNRFKKFGGATPLPIFGYTVRENAKTYADWERDTTATGVIKRAAHVLRETQNYSATADWLNNSGVPTGPSCTNRKWSGAMVRRFFANTLLKGAPRRGTRHSIKHHETGRRVSVRNPDGPIYRSEPHLAHLEEDEFDTLNELLRTKNANNGRKRVNGQDPRHFVPRTRTRFPGQHSCCWYCGHQHVWGGNGLKANLMCNASRTWNCWNSIGFCGELAATRIVELITQELSELDGFHDQFRELVLAENKLGAGAERWEQLLQAEKALEVQKKNVKASLKDLGPNDLIRELMDELGEQERQLRAERRTLERLRTRSLEVPQSIDDLRAVFRDEFTNLALDSPEFGLLLRRIVPEFHVYSVRLCDSGHLLPRAKIKLALDGIVPDVQHVPGLSSLLSRDCTIDLFIPTQMERIRPESVHLASTGLGPKAISQRIAEHPTATAVQHALALDKKMKALGLDTPYVIVQCPPDNYRKLRRHKNAKYEFKPLEGYSPPAL